MERCGTPPVLSGMLRGRRTRSRSTSCRSLTVDRWAGHTGSVRTLPAWLALAWAPLAARISSQHRTSRTACPSCHASPDVSRAGGAGAPPTDAGPDLLSTQELRIVQLQRQPACSPRAPRAASGDGGSTQLGHGARRQAPAREAPAEAPAEALPPLVPLLAGGWGRGTEVEVPGEDIDLSEILAIIATLDSVADATDLAKDEGIDAAAYAGLELTAMQALLSAHFTGGHTAPAEAPRLPQLAPHPPPPRLGPDIASTRQVPGGAGSARGGGAGAASREKFAVVEGAYKKQLRHMRRPTIVKIGQHERVVQC